MRRNKILFIFILIISLFSTNSFAEEQLIFSLDLIRHGDRAPVNQLPKSPIYWKEGLGELTAAGINQEMQLGKQLRIKYIDQDHLLPKFYNANTIYVRSTDTKRTIKSAEALLVGLYPLSTRGTFDQKIPIHVVSIKDDDLLIVKPRNNIFALINRYLKNRSFWKEKTINIQDKLNYWSKVIGLPLNNSQEVDLLADNLYIRRLHHLPLPKGISDYDANEIISLGHSAIANDFKLEEVSHPAGREFLKTVTNYFKLSIQYKTPLKYVLLSGHDASIMSVMDTLGSPLEKIPPYASRLNFSLIKNGNKYDVEISYNNQPVYVPICEGTICTISQLDQLVRDA